MGAGSAFQGALSSWHARKNGARTRESAQWNAIGEEITRARESEREAWARADAMEARHDRLAQSRNRWRDAAYRLDTYVRAHCSPTGPELPGLPADD